MAEQEPQNPPDQMVKAFADLALAWMRLGGESLRFAERQWSAALDAAAALQDQLTPDSVRNEARSQPTASKLKDNGHRAIDLAVDAGTIYVLAGMKWVGAFLSAGADRGNAAPHQ